MVSTPIALPAPGRQSSPAAPPPRPILRSTMNLPLWIESVLRPREPSLIPQNTFRNTSALQSALRTTVRSQPRAVLRNARPYSAEGAQKVPTTGQGASQPAKSADVDRHNMTQAGNLAHATERVNKFAKRDPSLYPLSVIVAVALGCAGYFFATKATTTDGPARALQMHGVVQPWDEKNQDTHGGAVAQFKYRHKTREGHYEDSLPTLSSEVVTLKDAVEHKYKTV